MTSADTHNKTLQLLENNNYFGMKKEQITIVQQGRGVPALMDNDARMALEPNNLYQLQTKPHGHGDIHSLYSFWSLSSLNYFEQEAHLSNVL